MGRRNPCIQIKYTGLDILAMGVMIAEEWRPDVIKLFDFAEKINKGREAVKKLVRHYIRNFVFWMEMQDFHESYQTM